MRPVAEIVRSARRIAVAGWSPDPAKASNDVASYLAQQRYTILPVNPRYAGQEAHGQRVVGTIAEAAPVDVVLVFRRPEDVAQHLDDALAAKVPVFWMQLGISNEQVAAKLRASGVEVVQDRCFKIEHGRLGAGA